MIIKSVRVQNFRCIKDETLQCDELTALLGPNGSGKSSFLHALEMFYTSKANYCEYDFYNRDTSKEIIITTTFADLTEEEKDLFKKYVENDELSVEKIIKWPPTKSNLSYHGKTYQNPDFNAFRSAKGSANLRREYNSLRESNYTELPSYSNKDNAEDALKDWELSNQARCSRVRDDGQFFGFKEVGKARLEQHTKIIFVPAVYEAAEDAIEKRGSALTEIMDLVVRSVLSQQKEIQELKELFQERYERIIDPSEFNGLQLLNENLSRMLKIYVPDAELELNWMTEDLIDIPLPKADIKLVEDGFPSLVEHTGHGLQRAFILTLLQFLAVAKYPSEEQLESQNDETSDEEFLTKGPSLIIGIEEPELYQHPNRQRFLNKIFLKLSKGSVKGVINKTQILYTTHSPLFVDLKRFDNVRILHKVQGEEDKPKYTHVVFTTLDDVAKDIEIADGKPEGTYSGETLKPRLQTLMTPWMNEGFFANIVVLVEGEEDRAIILGTAASLGYDFESRGISVIPCMGKNNLDRPIAIFKRLEIPVFAIWDSDYGTTEARPENNHRLLILFGEAIEDWPERVSKQFACFKQNINHTLRSEIGEDLYDQILGEFCEEFAFKKKYACKNPQIMQNVIQKAMEARHSSVTIEQIVNNIVILRDL